MKLWHVLEGPYSLDDDRAYFIGKVQLVDGDPTVEHKEFIFNDFDTAYRVVRYFDYNILPLSEDDIGRLINEGDEEQFKDFFH